VRLMLASLSLLGLHHLGDACLRAASQGRRRFPRRPHLAPKPPEIGFRLTLALELEVEHDVVRIVRGLEDLVAAHARLLPLVGEAIKTNGMALLPRTP
jgi:hypothetical protein